MQRIGLFGGTFDPVHLGHLLVAQAAMEEVGLSRLYFIPASRSPFKPDRAPAPGGERLRLLRLALTGRPAWAIDEEELRRGGVSYTIDTVRRHATLHPGAQLHYVVGADHVACLPRWREAADLARLVTFIIVPRPTNDTVSLPPPFQGVQLRGFPLAISSSQIRDRVRLGLSIDLLVGGEVAEAITKNRLYL